MTERLVEAWTQYTRGRHVPDLTPTATVAEQNKIIAAHQKGAVIEAKGKDNLFEEFTWAVTEHPRFDFTRNHYRVQGSDKNPNQIFQP